MRSRIEWKAGTMEAKKVIELLNAEMGTRIHLDSGLGIKPMSAWASKRLIRRALQYAIENGRRSVTLVHKGNIMKFTEGAFRDWGYELVREEFAHVCVTEAEAGPEAPAGKVLVKDRIADYLSDACAAQAGGLGMAPSANIGDEHGVFEATHGTAPKYAGLDVVNPSSVILCGSMMFEFMGWREAARLLEKGITETIRQKRVTYDLHRQMEGAEKLKTSEFAAAIAANMRAKAAAA